MNTPLRTKGVSFQATPGGSAPLRRRTNANTSFVGTPELRVNDEADRNHRRSLADLQKRLSKLPQTPSTLDYNEEECKEQLMSCIKLNSENKIGPKNVWNIPVIDYMRLIFQKPEFGSMQLATSSLDAGTKVYSIRVDDVHAEGLKLAINMQRNAALNNTLQDQDEAEVTNEENAANTGNKKQAKKKRRKFQKGVKNFIQRDIKSLLIDIPKLDSKVFQSKLDKKNIGSTQLMNFSIPMDICSTEFLLSENVPILYVDDLVDRENESIPVKECSSMTICPHYKNFRIDYWDENESNNITDPDPADKSVLLDAAGLPIAELDGSIHDYDELPPEADDCVADENVQQLIAAGAKDRLVDVTNIQQNVMSMNSEYTYYNPVNNKSLQLIFAGPSHWKVKYIKRSASKYMGKIIDQSQKGRKRKVVDNEEISFENAIHMNFDQVTRLPRPKKVINDPAKVTFTRTTTLKFVDLTRQKLITKEVPDNFFRARRRRPINYEAPPYNYENEIDVEYCSQENNADHDDHDNVDTTIHEEVREECRQNIGDNLVEAPDFVERDCLNFAKTAKKMDMKKLKKVMWKLAISDDNTPYETIDEDQAAHMQLKETTFKDIYNKLPSKLNEKMREQLTPHLAFVALLHLCNEHCLKMIQHDTIDNVTIVPAK